MMTIEPGEPLASGRAADVFDQGDGTVLRRYRCEHDTEPEARLMAWLHTAGFPVPKVHHAAGLDIVMERISGPTMIEDLERRPWMVVSHVKTLANVQRRLSAIEAPAWVPTNDRIPKGSSLLHLDLHPMNVIMSPDGPVVIDWTNASRGAAGFDAALSYVLMAAFETHRLHETAGKKLITGLFRRARGSDVIGEHLIAAGAFRLLDPNVTAGERAAIHKMLGRNG